MENAAGTSLTGSDVLFEDQILTKEVKTSQSPMNPDTPQFVPRQPAQYLPATTGECMNSTNAPDNQPPTGERLHYLKKYIVGQVKDTVESYFLLPPEDAFEERYGKQFVIADAFRDKLENWQCINPRDGTALKRCADFLRQPNTAIKSIGSLRVLNDEHAVQSTEKYLERKTATTTIVQKRIVKRSHQELMVLAVIDIVNQLIQGHIQKKNYKRKISK